MSSVQRPKRRTARRLLGLVPVLLIGLSSTALAQQRPIERSFWLHASLGLFTQHGYFGPQYPPTKPPTQAQVRNAAALLTGTCAANRLYLIYHHEMPVDDCKRVFAEWREACPAEIQLVPALVLRMYDQNKTPVFTADELADLTEFFRKNIDPDRIAVYDIAPRRNAGECLELLSHAYPKGLIRLGLQPGEPLSKSFAAAVQDTWSGFCHGKDNLRDWSQPGFGAQTLRQWVTARNKGGIPVTWNLITVAWDYATTERGGYPGYDDAEKNMPLPAGRNALGGDLIRSTAEAGVFAGFSSDVYILHENSRSTAHDGRNQSFYECLKRGENYSGYYRVPFQEIISLYRQERDRSK